MGGCDVTKKSSNYGVESYDYTIKYRLDDNYVSKKVFSDDKDNYNLNSNKRRHADRANVKLRLGKRVNSHQQREVKQNPRFLPDLVVTAQDPVEAIANEIAEKLAEEKAELVGK
jgi:phosphorylated adapter RNA export protein